jgi:very-short-patch-repair endonuclease
MDDHADAGKRNPATSSPNGRDVNPPHAGKRDVAGDGDEGRNVHPRVEPLARAAARLGAAQQGTVSRAQLQAAGVSRHVVDRLARSGALHRLHRGVYAVGHLALALMAREVAALLACGDGALISHRSAAYLWGLVDSAPREVDVTLVGRQRRPKRGIRIYRVSGIDDRDVRRKGGLWLASPARTLIDLAAEAGDSELDRLVAEARVQGLLSKGALEAALERAGRRPGTARMRAFLRSEGGPALTRSEAERRMRRLLREARLAQPKANIRAAGYSVDFLWAEQRVIVEVDGYKYHGHRRAFERDRRKDMALRDGGYEVIRITWRQLTEQALMVVAHVARALDRAERSARAAG